MVVTSGRPRLISQINLVKVLKLYVIRNYEVNRITLCMREKHYSLTMESGISNTENPIEHTASFMVPSHNLQALLLGVLGVSINMPNSIHENSRLCYLGIPHPWIPGGHLPQPQTNATSTWGQPANKLKINKTSVSLIQNLFSQPLSGFPRLALGEHVRQVL